MKKVNISLVGGQPMPVYMGIKATNPDSLILVHSKDTFNDSKIIKENSDLPTRFYEFPPVDYPEILKKAEDLLNQLSDDEVFINVSSGTKPWSIAFSLLAEGRENVTVFYIDQTTHFHDFTHKTLCDVEAPKSIETVLKYHNQRDFEHQNLSSYSDEDWRQHWEIRKIRNVNRKEFTMLTSLLDKGFKDRLMDDSCNNDSITLPSGAFIAYDKKAHCVDLEIRGRYDPMARRISSPMAMEMVFNSGWFEYEVAKMFQAWSFTKDIWMNVIFPSSNKKAKNEIDIIVDLGSRLLFIECKAHLNSITDIDKFRTAVNNFGGTGSIALLVSDDTLSTEAKEKCDESNVIKFSLEEAFFHNKEKSMQRLWNKRRSLLLSFMENNLNVINKK